MHPRPPRLLPLLAAALCACAAAPAPAPKCPPSPAPIAVAVAAPAPAAIDDDERVVSAGDFTFAVRARSIANLSYQLDCLADAIHCSKGAIEPLWRSGWTRDDDDALAAWKDVRKTYALSAPFQTEMPPSALPLPHDAVEIDHRVRIAALLAGSMDEYRRNLRVLLPPQDAERLASSMEHFLPRFEAWWTASGAPVAARFREGLEALFTRGELGAIVTRVARFFATPLPRGTEIDFDLVILPGPSKSTSAEQMVSHGVIEVLPDEKPEERMDVVCHELFHFFFNARTAAQQAALAARFGGSPDPLAAIAYFLLDESVATALGNGVVDHAVNPPDYAKRSKREMGFYGNHAIDATAKGLLARTKGDPSAATTLDAPEMARALIEATRDAVGSDPRPIEYLHSVGGASEPGWWGPVMEGITRSAASNNVYDHAPLDAADAIAMVREHPSLSAVLLVPRAKLAALAGYGDAIPREARAAIAREAKTKGPFAYVARRSPHALLFVLVADEKDEARALAASLFASDAAVVGAWRPR